MSWPIAIETSESALHCQGNSDWPEENYLVVVRAVLSVLPLTHGTTKVLYYHNLNCVVVLASLK